MMWIDVVDSAVKIGLGALIAGLFSFKTIRVTHDHTARTEYARRRRDILEKVLDLLNTFDKTHRHQKALYDTFRLATSPHERGTVKNEFEKLDEQLRLAFEKFADASGILLILGETDAEAALDEYTEAANERYELELPQNGQTSAPSLDQLKAKVISKRRALMEELAIAYKTM